MRIHFHKLVLAAILAMPLGATPGAHPRILSSALLTAIQARLTNYSGCGGTSTGTDTCSMALFIKQAEYIASNYTLYYGTNTTNAMPGTQILFMGQFLNGLTNGSAQSCMTNVCSNLDSQIAHTGNDYMTRGVAILVNSVANFQAACGANCYNGTPGPNAIGPYDGNAFRDFGAFVAMSFDLACGLVGSGSTACQTNGTWGWGSTNISNVITAITESSQYFLHCGASCKTSHTASFTTISQGTGPGSNQWAWYETAGIVGYLTYGNNATDSGGVNDEITSVSTVFNANDQPWWNNAPTSALASGQGGHHFESPEYGPVATWYALQSFNWIATLADNANTWAASVPNMAAEIPLSILHNSSPAKTNDNNGTTAMIIPQPENDTQLVASNVYMINSNELITMALAFYAAPSSLKPYIKFWFDNLAPTCENVNGSHDVVGECRLYQALFYDQTVTATDYRNGALPTGYLANGMGHVWDFGSETTPSTPWSDTNASWFFHRAQWQNDIHQNFSSAGDITLFRHGQHVIDNPAGYLGSQWTPSSWTHSVFESYDSTNGGGLFRGGGPAGQKGGVPLINYFESSLRYTYVEDINDAAYANSTVCNANNCQSTEPGTSVAAYSGSGLNDLTTGGKDTRTNAQDVFTITVSSTAGPDQFTWTCPTCTTTSGGPTNFSYAATTLSNAITIKDNAVPVSAASWASSTGTLTLAFANGASGTPVNSGTVTLAGFAPSAWNGTYTITSTALNQVQCTIASNPGAVTTKGTVTFSAGAVGHTLSDTWTFHAYNIGNYTNPQHVSREVVYVKPTATVASDYIFVYDRGTFTNAAFARQSWMLPNNNSTSPSLSGSTVSGTTTSNSVFVTYPQAGMTITTDRLDTEPFIFYNNGYFWHVTSGTGFLTNWPYYAAANLTWYTARAVTNSSATAQGILGVVEAADSGSAHAVESLTNGQAIAGHAKDSRSDVLVIFSANNPVSAITLPFTITYTPSSTNSTILATGLPVSTALCVAVTRAATWAYTFQTCGAGTAATSSANGTLFITDNGTSLSFDALTIQDPTPIQTPATQNIAYSHQLYATGGKPSYTWTLASGSLPTGLSLSSAGLINGTPTGTTTSFIVQNTDANSTVVTKAMTLNVLAGTAQCVFGTNNLPSATVSLAYNSGALNDSGCAGPTFSFISGQPGWASINSSTGAITGTPPNTTGSPFTVNVGMADTNCTVNNSGNCAQALTLTVGTYPPSVQINATIGGTATTH